ncbi:epoxyqueuosine reductase [Acidaminobacter hydrogenoformans]|uniref:Epoxyqueuosine reductase n=1 Tax=Acidaminobacter hydrogenoformans DSM 2784 TaxID=1120920 RepID=A0A1G5S517_9FIRM|nr:epoxyqueuosine reductase [Acidaminobacter hydrogenoformans]SCZ81268.1 epoxyqueuosine reductase [Acidaminobacter hydrogenoformans DSM 2784]
MISFQRLKAAAQTLGIPIIGTLEAMDMPVPERSLASKLKKGAISGFEPPLELVGKPEKVMPGVKSIIVIGLPYELFPGPAADPLAVCEVSAMAWGYDYHDRVKEKLAGLASWLRDHDSGETMVFCDTGPLNDRYLAFLAGLGTYGRNQLLIHERWGSAVVYGYLLTKATLESTGRLDAAPYSECGSCRLCQEACPSGALQGDYEFATTRCISNLTQQKRALTEKEMDWMGTSLYGCDICQRVCPKNKKREESRLLKSATPNRLNPFELFSLNKRGFQERFHHHGFAWRGLKTLQRNALINLYNSGNVQLLATLAVWEREGKMPAQLCELSRILETEKL